MSKLKEQLKELEKQQKKYQKLIVQQQSTCPHVSKKGKRWLEVFTENGIKKARCKKCNAVVLVDDELLTKDSVELSTNVVRAALSELKAKNHTKQLDLDSNTLKLIAEFDSNILADLPAFMETVNKGGLEQKTKKKKKKKNKNKKRNKRSRWN
jgi:hypothetical protein